jgi:phytoene dehydrogenase-like protein
VLERRGVVGGAAVNEEFHPGFRNSVASSTVSLLAPRVMAEMRLHERGLRILGRPIANCLPLDDGRFLKVGGGLARTQGRVREVLCARRRAVAGLLRDARRHRRPLLRELSLQTPPDLGALMRSGTRGLRQARAFGNLSVEQRRDLLDLFSESAADFLDGWFEAAPVRAALAFDGVVGNLPSPWTPGSAYVLLHHTIGGVSAGDRSLATPARGRSGSAARRWCLRRSGTRARRARCARRESR